jgi:hypothetical protein
MSKLGRLFIEVDGKKTNLKDLPYDLYIEALEKMQELIIAYYAQEDE